MLQQNGRYPAARPPSLAEGWTLERITPVSRFFGANGMRLGADGRIYVAQFIGSQISAIDINTRQIEVVSPLGGHIVGPDDLAFDARGNMYVTEFVNERVSVRSVDGQTKVLRDDLPSANGITFFKDRLFIDENRHDGRVLELDLNGGAPRVLLENVPLPNALAPGPDGLLYFPVMGTNEIWRVNPEGGAYERVAGDLGIPDAVKFDSKGFIVSTQVRTGEVLRIDPQNGNRTVLAALDPGLDNLTFVGDRLFVSHLTDGRVTEILADGKTKELLPGALNGPLGLAMGDDGQLYIADNTTLYALKPGGTMQSIGRMFGEGFPGNLRGVATVGNGTFAVATTNGGVALYRPYAKEHDMLAEGLDQLYGIAVAPGGAIVVVEFGKGRVLSIKAGETTELATGLRDPIDVEILSDGTTLVSESGAGRVVKVTGTGVETVVDGLQRPQGIVVQKGILYIVDAGAKKLIAYDLKAKTRRTIAADLPVGAPPGVTPKPLRGVPWVCGPFGPFASIAAGPDGTLYVSADGEGRVIALHPAS